MIVSDTDPGMTYDLWYDPDAAGAGAALFGLPAGGEPGQLLQKSGDEDGSAVWRDNGIPSGGNEGEVLAISPASTPGQTEWVPPPPSPFQPRPPTGWST